MMDPRVSAICITRVDCNGKIILKGYLGRPTLHELLIVLTIQWSIRIILFAYEGLSFSWCQTPLVSKKFKKIVHFDIIDSSFGPRETIIYKYRPVIHRSLGADY